MTDIFSKKKRSEIMSRIKGKDTSPEKKVRSLLHRLGYRFRLHRRDLKGKPDIVLPKYRKIIFVHGCFWHGHETCARGNPPKTNKLFWNNKINDTKRRDKDNIGSLKSLGWEVLVIWECETKNEAHLKNIIGGFLPNVSKNTTRRK